MNQPIVNDLVVRFANVNGTGSASANNIFSKAIFRMGLPVSPKNIFPSNIQGLPTWYEVRISEAGYLGRREGIDIMVGVNPQSLPKDIASLREGGYLVYDSSKKLHPDLLRSDIHYLGIPMMELAMQHFERPRTQQLLKNIIYLGAMAAFLDMELDVIKDLISEQFAKKPKLVLPNHQALELGYNYAKDHYACPLPIRVARRDLVKGHIMMEGNAATGLGAIYAGATVAAWYPITPSTSVVQSFEKYANQLRIDAETGEKNFAVIQAEDELAAIGMVIGATWNGARAFTATSGPGVSLMSEFLGLAYYAEIPVVLVNVQRGGPSTGMPTRTQQADIISSAYASHGDTRHVLLFPSTPTECFEMAADAFDLAERLQTPVIVMSDLDLGMNFHMTPALKWDENRTYDRGKVLSAEDLENMDQPFGRYLDVDGDGIPYRTFPGTHPSKGAFFTRGTSKDEYARYTESGEAYVRGVNRLIKKWNTAKEIVPRSELLQSSNQSETGIIFFGTSTYATEEALDQLRENGESVDALRIKAFPFDQTLEDFIAHHKRIFVIEQNRDAQMRTLLIAELDADPQKLIPLLNYDGMPITAARIIAGLKGEKIPLKV
ncbi:MAG: 2-oxoacid:acceptor oxidoreductase subunit alpha [Bacteroidota bacterium]